MTHRQTAIVALIVLTFTVGCATPEQMEARRRASSACYDRGWTIYSSECIPPYEAKLRQDRDRAEQEQHRLEDRRKADREERLQQACISAGGRWMSLMPGSGQCYDLPEKR